MAVSVLCCSKRNGRRQVGLGLSHCAAGDRVPLQSTRENKKNSRETHTHTSSASKKRKKKKQKRQTNKRDIDSRERCDKQHGKNSNTLDITFSRRRLRKGDHWSPYSAGNALHRPLLLSFNNRPPQQNRTSIYYCVVYRVVGYERERIKDGIGKKKPNKRYENRPPTVSENSSSSSFLGVC